MHLLSKMIIFATQKHDGQKCKGGLPYILHPVAVMNNVSSIDAKIVAICHDLLEDTDTTVADLKQLGCSDEIILAIQALTKFKGEGRVEAAHRVSQNRLACEVKIADVSHNMDLSRLPEITDSVMKRHAQYQQVLDILLNAKAALWNNFE
ncbi:guanosine-3',5'-bis(diphosphate) 3'-pyrophosphohydrolase [Acinetobacter baumannii]|uniref:guanosine-3',5'-bis(diphosphate) 3'-pyrophosphohydrolase n=1 Tax=Acinetobacter baumannii TaxID=470 RepID=UPI0008DCEEAF|nr:guanosine-3',5'-bis(diphosphate) 3'-pyrophosphohydrolase [Acinetobacter baumannii]OIH12235.1 guanosine-3',5'-bis(diphosphate) 3'-pyrophosphohydrolase [Acinetobacter baumannii]